MTLKAQPQAQLQPIVEIKAPTNNNKVKVDDGDDIYHDGNALSVKIYLDSLNVKEQQSLFVNCYLLSGYKTTQPINKIPNKLKDNHFHSNQYLEWFLGLNKDKHKYQFHATLSNLVEENFGVELEKTHLNTNYYSSVLKDNISSHLLTLFAFNDIYIESFEVKPILNNSSLQVSFQLGMPNECALIRNLNIDVWNPIWQFARTRLNIHDKTINKFKELIKIDPNTLKFDFVIHLAKQQDRSFETNISTDVATIIHNTTVAVMPAQELQLMDNRLGSSYDSSVAKLITKSKFNTIIKSGFCGASIAGNVNLINAPNVDKQICTQLLHLIIQYGNKYPNDPKYRLLNLQINLNDYCEKDVYVFGNNEYTQTISPSEDETEINCKHSYWEFNSEDELEITITPREFPTSLIKETDIVWKLDKQSGRFKKYVMTPFNQLAKHIQLQLKNQQCDKLWLNLNKPSESTSTLNSDSNSINTFSQFSPKELMWWES